MDKMKKEAITRILFVVFLAIFTAWIASMLQFWQGCAGLRQDVLRLHILANSDTAEDQQLKLLVRDEVLAHWDSWLPEGGTKDDMMAYIDENIQNVEQIAAETLQKAGCDLPVKATLARSFFDTRVYEETVMPAGWYDALQITIGSGAGKNWWCVLYPPLCLPAAEGDAVLSLLSPEEQAVVTSPPRYQIRFLTVELVEELGRWLRR